MGLTAHAQGNQSRRRVFEEFHPNDTDTKAPAKAKLPATSLGSSLFGLLASSTPSTSYELLAQACGGSAAAYRKWAKIQRLQNPCEMFENIVQYVKNSSDGATISVQQIYKIQRTHKREPFSDSYRILLWHGTKPSCIPGILEHGMKPGTGGCFGGGMYFADRIAKSSGYAGGGFGGRRFFVLAEVAPGKVYKAHHMHTSYKKAPPKFNSVKGMGSQIPTWKENKKYYGAILPSGKTQQNPRHSSYDMTYNEYIIYDSDRIIVRYIVECT